MHIAEWVPQQRIVLTSTREERASLRGCGIGCFVALLLPAAIAVGVPLAAQRPFAWGFVIAWGLVVLLGGGLASAMLRHMWYGQEFRADRAEDAVTWTEYNPSARLRTARHPREQILSMKAIPPAEPDERGSARLEFALKEGTGDPPFVDLDVDWLATEEETLELAHAVAGILGFDRYEELPEEATERRKGETVSERRRSYLFRAGASLPVPALAGPFPAFGKGRFEDASRLPGWERALSMADWRETMGVPSEASPDRLEIRPAKSRFGVLWYLLAALLLAGVAWLMWMSGRIPATILVPAALVLSAAGGILTNLFWLSALSGRTRHVVVDATKRAVEVREGRTETAAPFNEVRRVVLVLSKPDETKLVLDAERGAFVLKPADEKERLAIMALARHVADRLGVPCVSYRPRPETERSKA